MQNVAASSPSPVSGVDSAPVCQSGSRAVLEKKRLPPGKFTQTAVLEQWVDDGKNLS